MVHTWSNPKKKPVPFFLAGAPPKFDRKLFILNSTFKRQKINAVEGVSLQMKDLQKLHLTCAIDRAIQKISGAKKPQKPISCGVLRKFPCGVFAGSDPASLDPAKDLAKYCEQRRISCKRDLYVSANPPHPTTPNRIFCVYSARETYIYIQQLAVFREVFCGV